MDITTNRVDAMNHYGIAREAAAIYNVPLLPLDTSLPERSAAEPFPVRIEAPDLCGRFTAQVIRNVRVAPSEGVIAHYFSELGQKPISNAVDISNYVLLGMGHPNHVFDLDKLDGGIVVRRAHAGEQIKLLDGTTRTLVAEDLVIADESKALGLAGVMGGFDSMITAETKNILIEAAWFEPATIRASSRRHLIHTDASHRYERGADFNAPPVANALVAKHILKACGGQLEGALVDVVVPAFAALTANRPPISLSIGEVQRILGTTIAPEGITAALVERFLTALGCKLTATGAGRYDVQLPSWRLDLTREIDLIEEIARVYGYNGFANTLPTPGTVIAHPYVRAERAIRNRLYELGFSEAISSTFASATDSAFFAPNSPAVALENPLNEEAANLRPSLLPGMVTMLAHNLNRDVLTARLFESGAIFTGSAAIVQETASLALGATGATPIPPLQSAQDAPFYELKGAIESLLSLFDMPRRSVHTRCATPGIRTRTRSERHAWRKAHRQFWTARKRRSHASQAAAARVARGARPRIAAQLPAATDDGKRALPLPGCRARLLIRLREQRSLERHHGDDQCPADCRTAQHRPRRNLAQRAKVPRSLLGAHPRGLPVERTHAARRRPHRMVVRDHLRAAGDWRNDPELEVSD